MLKLYENIKALRLANKWSQTELAGYVGYSDKSMISKIEKGVIDLPQSQIKKFAEVFHVSPSDLLGEVPMDDYTPALPRDHQKLLDIYDSLSDDGKALLLGRADELVKLGYTTEEEAKKEDLASG